ncbi:hypothetical protein M0Q50_07560 [bacterium]|jgi:hypothetical protein|nr:hypothetical protein [bacterium]
MKKNYLIILSLVTIALVSGVYQYCQTFKNEIVDAYQATKPINGHSWAEMQCTSDACLDTTNHRMGIGTDAPTKALEVVGDIYASGDICNSSGCLAGVVSNQLLVSAGHTYGDCLTAGGSIVDTSSSLKQCKFVAASCPSGWTQYQQWGKHVDPGTNVFCTGRTGGGYCSGAWDNNVSGNVVVTLRGCSPDPCSSTYPTINYWRYGSGCFGSATYCVLEEIGCY